MVEERGSLSMTELWKPRSINKIQMKMFEGSESEEDAALG